MRNSHRLKFGPALAVAASLLLTACAGEEPAEPEGTGGSEGSEAADGEVDLGPGETREEQIEELETVVELIEEHMGDGLVLRAQSADEWTPEYHEEYGAPVADCGGGENYRNQVSFDHTDIEMEEAYAAAEQLSEELGFTPNEALNDTGTEGTGRMIFASVSDGTYGRTFTVRESRKEDENVQVIYKTPCSDHPSNHEALMEFVERDQQERMREDEERREG